MSTLQDTGPLYHAGPPAELCELGVAPGGSAAVLAGALFLDRLPAPPIIPSEKAV